MIQGTVGHDDSSRMTKIIIHRNIHTTYSLPTANCILDGLSLRKTSKSFLPSSRFHTHPDALHGHKPRRHPTGLAPQQFELRSRHLLRNNHCLVPGILFSPVNRNYICSYN